MLIPVNNEADALASVLPDVQRIIATLTHRYEIGVYVVDDGSVDGSGEVARSFGFPVIEQSQSGKPRAVYRGLDLVVNAYRQFIIFDGDGQHAAANIPEFLETLVRWPIVKGTRFHPSSPQHGTPEDRTLLNRVTRTCLEWKTGWRITDPQCGLIAMSQEVAKWSLTQSIWDEEWEICFILALKCAGANGCPIHEIPIAAQYSGLPGHKQIQKYRERDAWQRLEERLLRQLRIIMTS